MTQIYIKQNIHKHRTQNFRRISPLFAASATNPLSRTSSSLRCSRHDQDRIRGLLLRHLQCRPLSCCVFGVRERQRGINTEYHYLPGLCNSPALPCVEVAEGGRGALKGRRGKGLSRGRQRHCYSASPQASGEAGTVAPKRVISVNPGVRPQKTLHLPRRDSLSSRVSGLCVELARDNLFITESKESRNAYFTAD